MSYARGQMFSALGARIANIGTMIQQSREAAELRAEQKAERERINRRQDMQDAIALAEMHGGPGDAPTVSYEMRAPAASVVAPPAMRAPRVVAPIGQIPSGPLVSDVGSAVPTPAPRPSSRPPVTVTGTDPKYMNLPGGGHIMRPEAREAQGLAARLAGDAAELRQRGDIEREYADAERTRKTGALAPHLSPRDVTAAVEGVDLYRPPPRGSAEALRILDAEQAVLDRHQPTPQGRSTDPTPTAQFTARKEQAKAYLDELARIDARARAALEEGNMRPGYGGDVGSQRLTERAAASASWGFKDENDAKAAFSYKPQGGGPPAGSGAPGTSRQTITQDQADFLRTVRGMSDADIAARYIVK